MESTSTVDTDESDPTLPSYKKIEGTHEAFLTAFLPSYLAFEQTVLRDAEKGRKQREFKKGSKKDFVNDNITTKLVDEFKLDLVYNLDSVRKKIARYFYNKGLVKNTGETVKSAIDVFRVEEEAKITVKAAELMETTPEDLKKPGLNLTLWKTARDELFQNLDEKTKATYQTIADEQNEKLKNGPAGDEIYRNQSAIVPNIARALQSSIGYGWGGHGDVGLFVAGVYRDNLNVLRTFSLSTQAQAGAAKFSDHISDLMPDLRTGLKSWGEEVLPKFAIGIHKWYDETVPEKTDDIVIKINLKSEDATSSSSYEQFCPATMTKLQSATLYERIIEDDDRETPLLRFLGGTPLPPAAKSKHPVPKAPVPSGGPVDYSLARPGASPPSSKRAAVSPAPSEMSSVPPSVVDESLLVQLKKKQLKKRRGADDAAAGPSESKKAKLAGAAVATRVSARATRARGGVKSTAPVELEEEPEGRQIKGYWYPKGAQLPLGYAWSDEEE
ncbi:hypothetical protein C8J57DRAFT_1476828 [Mycena rebaudengoi]|nr:hypothetical protein C8J57DRAFT_1476828 [Mycena rebaudengoi]